MKKGKENTQRHGSLKWILIIVSCYSHNLIRSRTKTTKERKLTGWQNTHRFITLFDSESHVTPFHLHGSGSSGLHLRMVPSELIIADLKLKSASPTDHIRSSEMP